MPFRYFRLPISIFAIIVLAALASNKLPGQPSSQGTAVNPKPIIVNIDLVNVLCSVFDKGTNSFITNLTQNDFTLYEDGKKQEITHFVREKDLPLTIALLIDTSSSTKPKLKFEQEAAISFVQSVLRKEDQAMLLQFDSGLTLLQDFTNDPNRLSKQIRNLQAAGGTSLYDAIYRTCDEKMFRAKGRKVMVILSDGEDEESETTIIQATEMALKSETMVYAISLSQGGFFGVEGGRKDAEKGDEILTNLAQDTGGKIFFPFMISDLDDYFRQITQELRSQYSIGYTSNNALKNGKFRKLEIKVPGGFKLNYRKGYYAPVG
jgi:Ca-activated chloride channel family protein